jgi:hypothetical protein
MITYILVLMTETVFVMNLEHRWNYRDIERQSIVFLQRTVFALVLTGWWKWTRCLPSCPFLPFALFLRVRLVSECFSVFILFWRLPRSWSRIAEQQSACELQKTKGFKQKCCAIVCARREMSALTFAKAAQHLQTATRRGWVTENLWMLLLERGRLSECWVALHRRQQFIWAAFAF